MTDTKCRRLLCPGNHDGIVYGFARWPCSAQNHCPGVELVFGFENDEQFICSTTETLDFVQKNINR
jgi:hypothetical protein